jgi:hypothetical protein
MKGSESTNLHIANNWFGFSQCQGNGGSEAGYVPLIESTEYSSVTGWCPVSQDRKQSSGNSLQKKMITIKQGSFFPTHSKHAIITAASCLALQVARDLYMTLVWSVSKKVLGRSDND